MVLQSGEVKTEHIANRAVTSGKLQDKSVSTAKLQVTPFN